MYFPISLNPYCQAAAGGAVVGTAAGSRRAVLQVGEGNENLFDLNPIGFGNSTAVATNGTQQVGSGGPDGTHAALWNGSANTAVDLHPTKFGIFSGGSFALGTNGSQQVGYGDTNSILGRHALLWNGSADSAVDLFPTNITGLRISEAFGTDGTRQVGFASGAATNGFDHAMLWYGTADSAVDLHPTLLSGFLFSDAYGTDGGQEVGSAYLPNGHYHAMLWTGTPESAVDLHPINLAGFRHSQAISTNGTLQVGYGSYEVGGNTGLHALLWSGTAASAVDLNDLLPAGYVWSTAFTVDQDGNVFGVAMDGTGVEHAVMWSVPEPSSLLLLPAGLLGLRPCTRR
jgi:hypothetical protein